MTLDSVQKKLLLVVGLTTILIFGGVTVYFTYRSTQEVSKTASEKLERTAGELASGLTTELQQRKKVAQTLAATMESYRPSSASREEVLSMLEGLAAKNPDALGVYLAYEPDAFDGQDRSFEGDSALGSNEDGRFAPYWNRFGDDLGLDPLEDLESQDWYTTPLRSGEPLVKGPFSYDGRLMLSFLQPIHRDGETIGVAGVDVSIDYWQKLARQAEVEQSGYAFIVDAEGTFLAHPHDAWVGKSTLRGVADSLSAAWGSTIDQQLDAGTGGSLEITDPVTGTEAFLVHRPMAGGRFSVAAVAPRTEVLAGVDGMRNSFLGVGLVSLILLLGGTFYPLRRAVVVPLRRVTESVKAVAEGDTSARVEVQSDDEVGELAQAFNAMADRIASAQEELERKTEEANQKAQQAREAEQASAVREARLQQSVDQMLTAMNRFAEGDLTVRLDPEQDAEHASEDEGAAHAAGRIEAIDRLFDGFNEVVVSVRQMVTRVQEAAESTSTAAHQISASSEQMAASVEEQSAQSEEVAAAVEELNQTINENAKSVQRTADAAETGGRQAREGQEVMAEATDKIEEISEEVQTTADAIERLGASSEEIGRVIDTIDEIANQTNLLALNAAIEAARAGAGDGTSKHTGQGFGVVAEEVRELAEETDAATTEISDMIEEVQGEIEAAVQAARRSSERAAEGIELSEQASAALDRIVDSIEQVEERADEIAAASEEQSTTSEEIARSVQSISTAAQQSAAGVTQVSESAHDLEALADTLRESVGRFDLEARSGAPKTVSPTASGGHAPSPDGPTPSPAPNWDEGSSVGGDGHPSDAAR